MKLLYILILSGFIASCDNKVRTAETQQPYRVSKIVYLKYKETGICYSQNHTGDWRDDFSRTCIPCDSLKNVTVLIIDSNKVVAVQNPEK